MSNFNIKKLYREKFAISLRCAKQSVAKYLCLKQIEIVRQSERARAREREKEKNDQILLLAVGVVSLTMEIDKTQNGTSSYKTIILKDVIKDVQSKL